MTLEEIFETYPEDEFLKVDGFDSSVIGVEPSTMRLVYDRELMVKSLMKEENMTVIDAIEYLEFNVFSAHMGDKTPIYIETNTII
jgi:hypothetical protein